MSNVSYRWLESPTQEEWLAIDSLLEKYHWMSLAPDFAKILVAEVDGEIVGISCLQGVAMCGPLLVLPKWRGTGVADKLADDTIASLQSINARGWIVIAESPHVPKLCRKHGMRQLDSPVFVSGA
jgi:GNAT superfamily N-acetyltransferase